ncbi:selenocysteine-tRNA-specific elongation factor [Trypanosoma cruzi]|nr:selenocysteine-tRNA-specific elongation factor [Trypanosoma cruzi]
MAVGASSRTAQRTPARERRQVIPPDVSGQFRVTTFLSLDAFALQHFSLDNHSATEEEGRMFRAFGVTTCAPRIWDEGASGVFVDFGGAHDHWKRADDQAQLLFDCLFAWIGALEAERDPTDRFMNLGRILLQAFRMQLMMASDPGIPVLNILARPCTAVHGADTFARAIQIPLERRGTQISLRCQLCHVDGHEASTRNVRDATGGSYSPRGRPSRNGEGLFAASYESGRRQLHPFHHLPLFRKDVTPHRRCSIRYYKLPDAIIEKGNGAYPPTTLDCGTTKHRHLRFARATRREGTRWLEKCGPRQRGSRE